MVVTLQGILNLHFNEIQNGGHGVRDLLKVIQGHETSASSKLSVAIFVDEAPRKKNLNNLFAFLKQKHCLEQNAPTRVIFCH